MMLAETMPCMATFGTISIADNLGVRGFVQGSYEQSEVGTDDTETDRNIIFDIQEHIHLSKICIKRTRNSGWLITFF